uniref:Uncharacterized protein n=1 Tax=Micrurus carvalhoi TaxID=3147026 RepID=A0A2H6NI55_9SAUR
MLPDKEPYFLVSPALKMLPTMIMTSLQPKTFIQRILTAQPANTEIHIFCYYLYCNSPLVKKTLKILDILYNSTDISCVGIWNILKVLYTSSTQFTTVCLPLQVKFEK